MPIAISAEQRALQASIRDWAERAGTLALVRGLEPGSRPEAPGSPAGPPGSPARPADVPGPSISPAGTPGGAPWAEHWAALAGLGIFSIALPEAAGGDGGTVADLAAALEQLTVALAAGPAMPTLLAGDAVYGFLLSRCLSIAGDTSQILLSVVAERALGLPRDEAR